MVLLNYFFKLKMLEYHYEKKTSWFLVYCAVSVLYIPFRSLQVVYFPNIKKGSQIIDFSQYKKGLLHLKK